MSLWIGLAHTVAVTAGFVQQLARDFLHTADMHSAPALWALWFYLYHSLKRFRIHISAKIIPPLIHGSLFLCLCGVVAFLVRVNIAMAVVTAYALAIFAVVYLVFYLKPSEEWLNMLMKHLVPFQMVYDDKGSLAAESLLERRRWVKLIWWVPLPYFKKEF
jgi:hypothetical protein